MSLEKRNVILAPFPRTMNEIFSERDLKRLASFANVLWSQNRELPASVLENLLPETWAFVAFSPPMSTERLRLSSQLKAILEVGGHFPAPSTTASVLPEAFECCHALQPLHVKSPRWPCR